VRRKRQSGWDAQISLLVNSGLLSRQVRTYVIVPRSVFNVSRFVFNVSRFLLNVPRFVLNVP
jgi:hypothetical protein